MVDLSQLSDAELVARMSGTPEEQEVSTKVVSSVTLALISLVSCNAGTAVKHQEQLSSNL